MERRLKSKLKIAALLSVVACAPQKGGSGDEPARVRVVMNYDSLVDGRALTGADGNDYALSDALCYVVHVTGEEITDVKPDELLCGPTPGLGQFSGQAYNKGDSAELTVKVGKHRRIDLIGIVPPGGLENGKAKCGAFSVETSPGTVAHDKTLKFKIAGVEASPALIVFATGEANIEPGDNVVTLQAIPKVISSVVGTYTFGAPYRRADLASAAAGCVASLPAAQSALQLFTTSSVGLMTPKVSGTAKLIQVSGTPVLMRVPAASGSATLSTGLGNIQRLRQ